MDGCAVVGYGVVWWRVIVSYEARISGISEGWFKGQRRRAWFQLVREHRHSPLYNIPALPRPLLLF
jgi:cation transport regulator ChaC